MPDIMGPDTEVSDRNQLTTLHSLKINLMRSLGPFDPASDDFGDLLTFLEQVMVKENALRVQMYESELAEPFQVTDLKQKRVDALAALQNPNP